MPERSAPPATAPAPPAAAPPAAPRVAFKTLGCKVNHVESEQIAEETAARGLRHAAEDLADVVVVNSCAVTAEAARKTRKAIRHAAALPHRPVVVVTGCVAALEPETLRALGERVVVEADTSRVAEAVATAVGAHAEAAAPSAGGPQAEAAPRRAAAELATHRTRRMLKVEDGCDAFCAYCIVPHARGLPASVPLARIEERARALVAEGVAEIVLTGINIGRYEDGDATLPDVVRTVAATGVGRLRISSIEPGDLTPALLRTLAETPPLCRHLHVPLQSGSDSVLRAMGRPYTAEEFAARIGAARDVLGGLTVTTDVMVGFPGETEADAAATRELVERIGFSKLHVFRFSPRTGTPAASMDDQVEPREAAARASKLRALGERIRERYIAGRAGKVAEMLVETVEARTARGTTRDYLKVACEAEGLTPGSVVEVRLLGGDVGEVRAERV